MIFDAAYAAMRDNGQHTVSIADILAAAGISTRSFYRHFESKDELLCAMYRRDAVKAAERLRRRVDRATNPAEAVHHWIDEIMTFGQSSAKAERVSVLGSIVVNRADGADEVARESRDMLLVPLREAIVAGVDAGIFVSPDPRSDAEMVAAVAFDAIGLAGPNRNHVLAPRARAAVHAFCFRALGADSSV